MKKLWLCILTIICLCVSVAFAACGNTTYTVTVEVDNAEYGSVSVAKVENVAKDTAISIDGATLTLGETKITATPSQNTVQYSYAFDKWTAAETVTDNITITACFKRTINKYIVKFVNDGEVLQEDELEYGAMPEYTGATPEKAATAQYTYTFDKWDKDIVEVKEDATYTATFNSVVNKYIVKFVNDGEVLQEDEFEYGAMPEYTGATPEKAATAQYTYTFDKWDKDIVEVKEDATYTATFNSVVNKYIVKFVNDGEVLQEDELEYGAIPKYTGATPEKAATAQYTYNFNKWDKAITTVKGNITYNATFTSVLNKYNVKWQDTQGVLSDKIEITDYGTTPTFPWSYFEKVGDGTYIYNISVEKSTDGGDTWGYASSYTGDYGESAMQPWGMDLNEFNAGLSAVTGDTIYKVNYNELNPVSVVSGGEDFAVVQDGNVFTFTNVVADGSTVNRFMIHSDLLRYYFNADETFLTLKVESAAGQSASFSVNTYWGYDANGGVVKSASGTDTVYVPAYHILSKAVSERHYWVDVVITDISDCDSFVLTIEFADTMYIKNATELSAFAALSNDEYSTGNYKLANDIDLGSISIVAPFDNSGTRYSVGFAGTFDGQGYTIKGGEYAQAGLFGNILSDAIVENFTLDNASWEGVSNDNALLAWTVSGTIRNINANAVYGSAKAAFSRLFLTYEINGATITDVNITVENNKVGTNVYPVCYWNKVAGNLENVNVSADRINGSDVLTTVGAGEALTGVNFDGTFYWAKYDGNGNIDFITENLPDEKEGAAVKLTRSAGTSGWATRFSIFPTYSGNITKNTESMTDKYLVFDFYYTASSGAIFRPNNNYVNFDLTVSYNIGYMYMFDSNGDIAYVAKANTWYTIVFDGNMLYGDRASGAVGNMYFNLGDTTGGNNVSDFDFANNAAYFADIRIIDEEELFASGLGWTLNESNFQKVSATNSVIATVTEDLPDGREGEAVKLTRNIGASAWADGRFIIAPAGSVDYSKKLLAGNYLVLDLYYTKDAGLVFRPNNNYVNFDATKVLNSSYVTAYDESGTEVDKITANAWYTFVFDGDMLYGDRTSGSIGNMILTLGDIGNGGNISTDANYYNELAAYFMNMRVVSANPFADIN